MIRNENKMTAPSNASTLKCSSEAVFGENDR